MPDQPPTTSGSANVTYALMPCSDCQQQRKCRYGPHPYREDIDGDETPCWLCDDCWQVACDDI